MEEGLTDPIPGIPGMNTHSSPIGSCGDEDMIINFRFFADEDSRRSWMEKFPEYEMPDREQAPYQRDHLLPQASYEIEPGDDWDEEEWDDEAEDDSAA